MKIYIETPLETLPPTCIHCDYSTAKCIITYKKINANKRPDWCPLRASIEIADKAKEKEDEHIN